MFKFIAILVLFIIGVSSNIFAEKAKSDIKSQNAQAASVYMVGNYIYTDTNNEVNQVAFLWKDGVITALNGTNDSKAAASSLVVDGSDVYVGGCVIQHRIESLFKNYNRACYWKNGNYNELSSQSKYKKDCVANSLAVSGTNVYAGGYLGMYSEGRRGNEAAVTAGVIGGAVGGLVAGMAEERSSPDEFVNKIVTGGNYWVNGDIKEISESRCSLNSIAVKDSTVYSVGYHFAGLDSRKIASYWEATKESVDLTNVTSSASAIIFDKSDRYIAGWCEYKIKIQSPVVDPRSSSGPVVYSYPIACYWKNGVCFIMSNANALYTNLLRSYATSIVVSGNDVYVGGYCRNGNGIDFACYWKNGECTMLTNIESKVLSLAVKGSDVYAAGYYGKKDSDITIACYWKNGVITTLTNGNITSRVSAIVVK